MNYQTFYSNYRKKTDRIFTTDDAYYLILFLRLKIQTKLVNHYENQNPCNSGDHSKPCFYLFTVKKIR
jgi:hypothetical protein